ARHRTGVRREQRLVTADHERRAGERPRPATDERMIDMSKYPYTAREIRDPASVLYAMTPGTRESAAAHTQRLEWADRTERTGTAGQAALTARHPDRSWWAQTVAGRERWERAAAAAIEFASEPTDTTHAPGPLKVGDTVLILPRAGQEYL